MRDLIKEYEQKLQVTLPADYKKVAELMGASEIANYFLDMRGIGTHWFTGKPYQMLNPKHINSEELGEFEFKESVVKSGENVLIAANEQFSGLLVDIGIEKIFVIAIANTMRDRDTGLFYLFSDNGEVEGLYACSLDLMHDVNKIRIADSLSDMFEIPDSIDSIVNRENKDVYRLKRSNPPVSIADIEKHANSHHAVFDINVNSAADFEQLVALMIKLSNSSFDLDNFKCNENDSAVFVSFTLAEQEHALDIKKQDNRSVDQFLDMIDILISPISSALRKARRIGDPRVYFSVYVHPDCQTQAGMIFGDSKTLGILDKTEYLFK